jgi:RNA binding exosome subunit
MFRADLFAADLTTATLDRLAEIIRNAGDILRDAERTSTVARLTAEGHLGHQVELIAAELRRRGF